MIVDLNSVKAEFENQKNNSLNVIRDKYCGKRKYAVECVDLLLNAMDPCLLKKEKESKSTIITVTTSALNFICGENFDSIHATLNDKNETCFNATKDFVIECFNTDLKSHFDEEREILWTLTKLLTVQRFCSDVRSFETCSIKALGRCKNKTLKNLMQNLMNHLTGQTKCKPSSNSGSNFTGLSIFSFLFLFFVKIALNF